MHPGRARGFICLITGAALLLGIAGCHSKSAATPENFMKGVNAHFLEHPECLFPDAPRFPYETTDPAKAKQMNALVASQLLTVSVEQDIRASRYTPTPAGSRLAPRFCYGHRVATSIESFTPPTPENGFRETNVVYRYEVQDVPVWAEAKGVRDAFPEMAKQITAGGTDKAKLAATIAGWQVPD